MARCSYCNKLVSYGEPEIEVSDERVEDGVAMASVRVALTCAECGSEVKEANLDFEESMDHDCEKAQEPDYSHSSTDWTATERVDRRMKNGKPSHHKTWRTYYGANVQMVFVCDHCGQQVEVGGTVEEQASGFEELY